MDAEQVSERVVRAFEREGLQRTFLPVVRRLAELRPSSVLLIGSRASGQNRVDVVSDMDVIFVWPDDELERCMSPALDAARDCSGVIAYYLGPGMQFGHLVVVRDAADPSISLDIGLASEHFISHYMLALPMSALYGEAPTIRVDCSTQRAWYALHLACQCMRECARGRVIYASDYLARARAVLLLLLSNGSDYDGMSRHHFAKSAETEILTQASVCAPTVESVMTAAGELLNILAAQSPEVSSVSTAVRQRFAAGMPQ